MEKGKCEDLKSYFDLKSDFRFDSRELRVVDTAPVHSHPNALFIFISAVETSALTDTDPWFLLSLRSTNVSLIESSQRVSGLQTLSDSRAAEQTAH